METIQVKSTPSQSFKALLDGQYCFITLLTRGNSLFCSLSTYYSNCWNNVICLNKVGIKPSSYYSFIGNIAFIDTQGNSDPSWEGLGTRYKFVYMTDDEAKTNLQPSLVE